MLVPDIAGKKASAGAFAAQHNASDWTHVLKQLIEMYNNHVQQSSKL